jgi:hypothetical protein
VCVFLCFYGIDTGPTGPGDELGDCLWCGDHAGGTGWYRFVGVQNATLKVRRGAPKFWTGFAQGHTKCPIFVEMEEDNWREEEV